MDMNTTSSMAGIMGMTSAASAAAASGTSSASMSMSMGGMGGMGDASASCKISMLWNWYTIDSCFLSSTWHVRSIGDFAGSCIGVVFLVVALEFLRRGQREFDRFLRRRRGVSTLPNASPIRGLLRTASSTPSATSQDGQPRLDTKDPSAVSQVGACPGCSPAPSLRVWEHAVRSLLFMLQFAVGYIIMLLAMYYNGYIIFMIFIGAFLGAFIFQWDTYTMPVGVEQKETCSNISGLCRRDQEMHRVWQMDRQRQGLRIDTEQPPPNTPAGFRQAQYAKMDALNQKTLGWDPRMRDKSRQPLTTGQANKMQHSQNWYRDNAGLLADRPLRNYVSQQDQSSHPAMLQDAEGMERSTEAKAKPKTAGVAPN